MALRGEDNPCQGDQAHQSLHGKDPMPAQVFENQAADHGRNHGRQGHDHRDLAEHPFPLAARQAVTGHGQGNGGGGTGAHGLNDPGADEHPDIGTERAEQAAADKEQQAGEQGRFAAQAVGERPIHQQGTAVGDKEKDQGQVDNDQRELPGIHQIRNGGQIHVCCQRWKGGKQGQQQDKSDHRDVTVKPSPLPSRLCLKKSFKIREHSVSRTPPVISS